MESARKGGSSSLGKSARKAKTSKTGVGNDKGGTGKTLTCVNLAGAMAKAGKKVLLIDGDWNNSLSIGLGFKKEGNHLGKNIHTGLIREKKVSEFICETAFENIFLVPGSEWTYELEKNFLGKPEEWRAVTEFMKDKIVNEFDHVIFDNHPYFGVMFKNIMSYVDYYLIPANPEEYSDEGLARQIRETEKIKKFMNPMLTFLGVVVTRYKKPSKGKENLHSKFIAKMREKAETANFRVFDTVIPEADSIETAKSKHMPITHYEHNMAKKTASSYISLIDEISPLLKGKREGGKTKPVDTSILEKNASIEALLV